VSAHGGNCCPPVAVVTGSSSGIGRAVAVEFAWAGYRVLLHGRKPSEQLDAVEQELQAIQLELLTTLGPSWGRLTAGSTTLVVMS